MTSDNTFDVVERPAHYNQGGIECIEYIKQVLGPEGFIAYCLGNQIKYTHRHKYKGKPQEDLKKARYYLNKAIETYGEMNDNEAGKQNFAWLKAPYKA